MALEIDNTDFGGAVRGALTDLELTGKVGRATRTFLGARDRARSATPDWESLRDRAQAAKDEALTHLPALLQQFERQMRARGGEVHYAATGEAACAQILDLARQRGLTRALKAKSMASEEIELNHHLAAGGVEAVETDLGEFIVQVKGERPSHIVGPALHLNRHDIGNLFREKLGFEDAEDIPERMTAFARQLLRPRFFAGEIGISGANFAIAETGSLVLFENEGNIRMTTTLPRLHIALVGIEKLLPRWEHLPIFLRLLPRSGTGQKVTTYVSVLSGPQQAQTGEGSSELHVILLDNGRSRMWADPKLREALRCIRCGACLNACPVYQHIGGHAYGSVYSGPIGSLVTPGLSSVSAGGHLAFASSLCGACKDICPVKINIPDLLLHVRAQKQGSMPASAAGPPPGLFAGLEPTIPTTTPATPWKLEAALERWGMRGWAWVCRSAASYERATTWARRGQRWLRLTSPLRHCPVPPLSGWTKTRDLPLLAPQSFRTWWKQEGHRHSLVPAESAPIRHIRPRLDHPGLPEVGPAPIPISDLGTTFQAEFERLGGKFLRGGSELEMLDFLTTGLSAPGPVVLTFELEGLGRRLRSGLEARGFEVWTPDAIGYHQVVGHAAAGITGVFAAVADTGTLVLGSVLSGPHADEAERNRRASLLPPVHMAVLRTAQLVENWEGLQARCPATELPPALTLITGPSRTADIELTLCVGVHGPREVRCVLLETAQG
ncbi:MAG: LUD domain-containing protein [Terriglobales bacterium]